jgi:DnaK suppressor protein
MPGDAADVEAVLRARERDVLEQLRRNAESAEPPSLDEEIGRLTRMDALQQQQMALHARRRLETQLAQIRGALARVDEGAFGRCALCGEPVDARRLEMVPETPFCVGCQTQLEEQGRR